MWNLHSPILNSPRRNQLLLFCNIELANKSSNGNIKVDFLCVTLEFLQDCCFFILTLNRQMLAAIYCSYFNIYRSSHQEVFSKKGVLRIFSQFTVEHPWKSVTSTLLKSHFCKGIVLYIYYISAAERFF